MKATEWPRFPVSGLAGAALRATTRKGRCRGDRPQYADQSVTHRLTSDQSKGSIYIFESTFEPGTGNRLHVPRREDEIAYVLEGALVVRLRDGSAILEAGGVGRLPKNLPHAIRNPLETPSRYLFLAVPGGLDQWFDAVAGTQGDGSLDDALTASFPRTSGSDGSSDRVQPEPRGPARTIDPGVE